MLLLKPSEGQKPCMDSKQSALWRSCLKGQIKAEKIANYAVDVRMLGTVTFINFLKLACDVARKAKKYKRKIVTPALRGCQ